MQQLAAHPRCAFGVVGKDTFVAVFRGRCFPEDIAHMVSALARAGSPPWVVTIVERDSAIGMKGREPMSRMLAGAEGHSSGWIITIEGKGFWASAARLITSSVRVLSRTSFSFQVVSTPNEACARLRELGHGLEDHELVTAVDHLRLAIGHGEAQPVGGV